MNYDMIILLLILILFAMSLWMLYLLHILADQVVRLQERLYSLDRDLRG